MNKVPVCIAKECMLVATFNLRGLRAKFCLFHKAPGMIKIRRVKRCAAVSCTRLRLYGLPDKPRMFCSEHKTDDMVRRIDSERKEDMDYFKPDTDIPELFDINIKKSFFDD
jgi:hypothetical protein